MSSPMTMTRSSRSISSRIASRSASRYVIVRMVRYLLPLRVLRVSSSLPRTTPGDGPSGIDHHVLGEFAEIGEGAAVGESGSGVGDLDGTVVGFGQRLLVDACLA